jgi:anti-sigma B factor antagonist
LGGVDGYEAEGVENGLLVSIVRPQDGVVVLTPTGELDLASQDRLKAPLQDVRNDGTAHIIIDLRTLRFMDSSGLRLLLDAWSEAQLSGRRLSILVGAAGLVRRVLEVSGCDAVLPLANELDDVLP